MPDKETQMSAAVKQSLHHKKSETTGKGFERAREILDAASDMFAQEGYASLSMRRVANLAGVTLGSVQHYYRTKNALVEAMLLHTLDKRQTAIDVLIAAQPDASPLEQFTAALDFFIEDIKSPVTQGLMLEIGALGVRQPFAAVILNKMFARVRKAVKRLIRDLAPVRDDRELNIRAALIVAQLMGLIFHIGNNRQRQAELAGLEQGARQAMLAVATRRSN